jgi:hypothetical protein
MACPFLAELELALESIASLVLMSFAVRSMMKMKIMSGSLACLALMASPAAAETQYQSTMSGSVKIEVAPQDANGQAQPKPGDTLTIHFVPPPKPPAEGDDDPSQKLVRCGEKWNRKLDAYRALLPKLNKDLAYYRQWESDPAQRPPKPAEPLLTRESYRACIYECLGDRRAKCPGGWPAETVEKN